MSEVLELPELPEHDGVAEGQIRRRRVHAELDAETSPGGQPLLQLVGRVDGIAPA